MRLSSKGQIVIPAHVRRLLGLETGRLLAVRIGRGRELILTAGEEAASVDVLLRRARSWAARSGWDPVEALHVRRREERSRHGTRRD